MFTPPQNSCSKHPLRCAFVVANVPAGGCVVRCRRTPAVTTATRRATIAPGNG